MTSFSENTPVTIGQLFPSGILPDSVATIMATDLTIDSREVMPGSIFVAVEGVQSHGKYYISQAIEKGAVAVLVESIDGVYQIDNQLAAPVVEVPNLPACLSEIAGNFYSHPSRTIPIVGITGTNGKTTCSQLYAQLSALLGNCSSVIGTMGYGTCVSVSPEKTQLELTSTGMTTPDPIRVQRLCAELIISGSDNIAIEVSSHGLEQGRVTNIDINTAVFTNLSHDHLDYHGSMAAYSAAKARLFSMSSVQTAVFNKDDEFSAELIQQLSPEVTYVTYSLNQSSADIYLSDIYVDEMVAGETVALLHTPKGNYTIRTRLAGVFNLSNLLAVLGIFYINGQSFDDVIQRVPYVMPIAGRMEMISNTLNKQVLVDYAHTPDALKNVLLAVSDASLGDVWCVFGCGGDRDKDKRPIMAEVAETYANKIVVTSDNPRNENPQMIIDDIVKGFRQNNYEEIIDREQAIHYAIQQSQAGDTIVIAGKGHEDYQLVGDKKVPFSDQQIARLTLRKIEGGQHD